MAWIRKVQNIILTEHHATFQIPSFLEELMKEDIKLMKANEKLDNDKKIEFTDKIKHIFAILLKKNAKKTEEKLRMVLRDIDKQDIVDQADGMTGMCHFSWHSGQTRRASAIYCGSLSGQVRPFRLKKRTPREICHCSFATKA